MTKFCVDGFTEALRREVIKRNVPAGLLEPGAVATELVSPNIEKIRDQLAASDAKAVPEPLQPGNGPGR